MHMCQSLILQDLVRGGAALAQTVKLIDDLQTLPPYYRDFYARRIIGRLNDLLGKDSPKSS